MALIRHSANYSLPQDSRMVSTNHRRPQTDRTTKWWTVLQGRMYHRVSSGIACEAFNYCCFHLLASNFHDIFRCWRLALSLPVGRPALRSAVHSSGDDYCAPAIQAELGGALQLGVTPQYLCVGQPMKGSGARCIIIFMSTSTT